MEENLLKHTNHRKNQGQMMFAVFFSIKDIKFNKINTFYFYKN